jgi:hypothetical protein
MTVDPDGRFDPTGSASGRDLDVAIRRIDAIAAP